MTLPEAMGGLGLSVLDHVLVKEAIYASGSPLAPHVLGELSGPPRVGALVRKATPHHMERFIVPVARAEKAICFALTEAEAGSDAGAVQTRAVREGEHFVLNGRKRFISGSPFADFAVLMASTASDPAQREVSAFFVDLTQPGVRVEAGYKTMAGQSHTGDIVLEDCRIPVANLGEPGRGPRSRSGASRSTGCCTARDGGAGRGGAARCLRVRGPAAPVRPRHRPVPGDPAPAGRHGDRAGGRALMLATARQIDAGSEARAEASMAKLFCSESAFRIADRAVQIHGGEGIVQGRRVEFLFRMLRMYRVLTGTSEIQRNTIARELLGDLPG